MPRQLPWAKKTSAATKTQVKSTPKPSKRTRNGIDDDEDFFADTVLATTRKGKERAAPRSDDDLPSYPTNTTRKKREHERADRLPSSSPPPANLTLSPPEKELMREALSRFDLRDDEWMMVEDELLGVAKTFTRHVHLTEYERLKKVGQIRRDAMRPVVPGAEPSHDRQLQLKAHEQLRTQKRALRDVLANEEDDVESYDEPPKRTSSSKLPISSFSDSRSSASRVPSRATTFPLAKQKSAAFEESSDGEDLDAQPRPTKRTRETSSVTSSKPAVTSPSTRPTPSRRTFDFLDDYNAPSKQSSSPTKASNMSSSPAKSHKQSATTVTSPTSRPRPTARFSQRPGRALDLFDDVDLPKKTLPKEQEDRIAKRKAEREKEKIKEKEKKDLGIDAIPTFLF